MNIELFPCSGGLAEGLRRTGLRMDMAFDKSPDACASYERNHLHRPINMDVNDLHAMVVSGWRPAASEGVDLLIADPPCVSWSIAGSRRGLEDERDCLLVTVDIIRLLHPEAYLIGNVPGLETSGSWHVIQEALAPLAADGYCVRDFASLNAVSFGVPQFRQRPFWYGHLAGPCVRWPAPTHGPDTGQIAIDGHALHPHVTCRQALQHLPLEQLGRPVRMRLRERGEDGRKNGGDDTRISKREKPARTVTSRQHHKGGQLLMVGDETETARAPFVPNGGDLSMCSKPDEPARTIVAHEGIKSGGVIVVGEPADGHQPAPVDGQAKTITKGARRAVMIMNDRHAPSTADEPAKVVRANRANTGAQAGRAIAFPERTWDNHPPSTPDAPAFAVKTNGDRIGTGGGSTLAVTTLERKADSNRGACSTPDKPAAAVTSNDMGEGVTVLGWPWDRPSTTIQGDERLGVPGHHDPAHGNSQHSGPNAVILSERAAAILQGFPDGECTGHRGTVEDGRFVPDDEQPLVADGVRPGEVCGVCGDVRRWHFAGDTKASRWGQIGMAMPIAMAEAVGRAIAEQRAATNGGDR